MAIDESSESSENRAQYKKKSRARKTSTAPSRIYSYRCLPPVEEAPRVEDQFRLAAQYRNKLVEVEHGLRAQIRDAQLAHPQVGDALRTFEDAQRAVETRWPPCARPRAARRRPTSPGPAPSWRPPRRCAPRQLSNFASPSEAAPSWASTGPRRRGRGPRSTRPARASTRRPPPTRPEPGDVRGAPRPAAGRRRAPGRLRRGAPSRACASPPGAQRLLRPRTSPRRLRPGRGRGAAGGVLHEAPAALRALRRLWLHRDAAHRAHQGRGHGDDAG